MMGLLQKIGKVLVPTVLGYGLLSCSSYSLKQEEGETCEENYESFCNGIRLDSCDEESEVCKNKASWTYYFNLFQHCNSPDNLALTRSGHLVVNLCDRVALLDSRGKKHWEHKLYQNLEGGLPEGLRWPHFSCPPPIIGENDKIFLSKHDNTLLSIIGSAVVRYSLEGILEEELPDAIALGTMSKSLIVAQHERGEWPYGTIGVCRIPQGDLVRKEWCHSTGNESLRILSSVTQNNTLYLLLNGLDQSGKTAFYWHVIDDAGNLLEKKELTFLSQLEHEARAAAQSRQSATEPFIDIKSLSVGFYVLAETNVPGNTGLRSKIYHFNGDGNLRWGFPSGYNCNSPVVMNGTAYFNCSNMFAVEERSGRILWQKEWFSSVGTNLIAQSGLIYSPDYRNVNVFSPEGNLQWTFGSERVSKGEHLCYSPLMDKEGRLYTGTVNNTIIAIETGEIGMGDSPWPRAQGNERNTREVSGSD